MRGRFLRRWLNAARASRRKKHKKKYTNRIKELARWCLEEAIPLSPESEKDFHAFVKATPGCRQAGLVAPDDGTMSKIRAYWDNEKDERVALHFHGKGLVSFVFKINLGGEKPRWESGRGSFSEVCGRIQEEGMESLLLGQVTGS